MGQRERTGEEELIDWERKKKKNWGHTISALHPYAVTTKGEQEVVQRVAKVDYKSFKIF